MAREEEIISDKREKKNLAISKTFKFIFSWVEEESWQNLFICISYENFLKVSFSPCIQKLTKNNLKSYEV